MAACKTAPKSLKISFPTEKVGQNPYYVTRNSFLTIFVNFMSMQNKNT